MTRWKANFDVHQTYYFHTLANKSSMYWPTLNCSRPLPRSTATALMTMLYNANQSDINKLQRVIIDEFDLEHLGGSDIRVKVDDIEGIVNESQGYIIQSGDIWSPDFRLHRFLTFYTSSNTSSQMRLTVKGYA